MDFGIHSRNAVELWIAMNHSETNKPQRPELLAPAGDKVSLRAALDAGADAVYFGAGTFNMRKRAQNFRPEDIVDVVSLCHEYGARAYQAINIIVYETELDLLNTALDNALQAGVDAIICWDQAVIRAARDKGLEVHLSTQASVSNSSAIIQYYRNNGIKRFVLARECSLDHLSAIRQNLEEVLGDEADLIELEVFIHGAMCVSVSGRCFMSESVNGESGNRGACLQPCRREYRIIDVEGEHEYELGRDYVMSPRDLCTMPFIEKILESGISSAKIEGRMRSPEYVTTVVGSYRKAIDTYFDRDSGSNEDTVFLEEFNKLKSDLTDELRTVFNRDFSSGYYMGRPVGDWSKSPNSQAKKRKETVGIVVNYYRKVGVAEIKVQGASFGVGDELLIQGPTTGNLPINVESIQVEHSPVEKANRGDHVAIPVSRRVRLNDAVFRRFDVD
jgi:putative protease